MKIAYVITRSDEVGGAHVHVRDLAVWGIEHGHDIRVFVGGKGVFTEDLSLNGIFFESLVYMRRSFSLFKDICAVLELVRKLKRFSPDIVCAHSVKAGLIARLASKISKIPCVFTAHGWSYMRGGQGISRFLYKYMEAYLSSCSDKVITVCESDEIFSLKNNLVSKDKVVTIYNGVRDLKCEHKKRNDSVVKLVMVARFEHPKDHLTLINALAELKSMPWHLCLVGDGPLMKGIERHVEALCLQQKVSFVGRRSDVHNILCDSNVFVLSTNFEGFPISILEAMRSSLPVLSINVAGIPECVIDGETGFLVSPGDVKDMSNKLKVLIEDKVLRGRMGSIGRRLFEKKFAFECMASATFSLYQHVLDFKK